MAHFEASDPLDTLLLLKQNIILTDAVLYEALRADKPDVDVIRPWLIKNKITAEPTNNNLVGKGNGEASIAELINDPQFSNQPYTIISDNKKDFTKPAIASKFSVDQTKIQTTLETLNKVQNSDALSNENYALIRDSINANAATAPGALGDAGLSTRLPQERLLSNEQLAVTPYDLPDGSKTYNGPAAVLAGATPVGMKGGGLPPAESTPQETIGGTASKFLKALGDEGAAVLVMKTVDSTKKVLGVAGLTAAAGDLLWSGYKAAQQWQAGDEAGARRSLSDWAERVYDGAVGSVSGNLARGYA